MKSIVITLLCFVAVLLNSEKAAAQAIPLMPPQGFSAPKGLVLGTTQFFAGLNSTLDVTDNERYGDISDQRDGTRLTLNPNFSWQGKFIDTTYFGSLGYQYYRTNNDADEKDIQRSFPLGGAGVTQNFGKYGNVSVNGSVFENEEKNSPEAGADAYSLRVELTSLGSRASFDFDGFLIRGNYSWKGAHYEYEQNQNDLAIEVDRDDYDYAASVGVRIGDHKIYMGYGGTETSGDTAGGIDVDTDQRQVGISAEGRVADLGYTINLGHGEITYDLTTIKEQSAFFGSVQLSYKVQDDLKLYASGQRYFANNILVNEPGYIINDVALSGQYDFSSKTFVKTGIGHYRGKVLATVQNYVKKSANITIGQHLTDNISTFLILSRTQQMPNDAALTAGYTKWKENKITLKVNAKF